MKTWMLAIAGCLAAATAAADPAPETIEACAERVAREPSCALELALATLPADNRLENSFIALARGIGAVRNRSKRQFARQRAEEWMLAQLSEIETNPGRAQPRRSASLLRALSSAGLPNVLSALFLTYRDQLPAPNCVHEMPLAIAYGRIGDSKKAIEHLKLALAADKKSYSGGAILNLLAIGCPPITRLSDVLAGVLAAGDIDAALFVFDQFTKGNGGATFAKLYLSGALAEAIGVGPADLPTVQAFVDRTKDPLARWAFANALPSILAAQGHTMEALIAARDLQLDEEAVEFAKPVSKLGILLTQLALSGSDSDLEAAKRFIHEDPVLSPRSAEFDRYIEAGEEKRPFIKAAPQFPAALAREGRLTEALALAGDVTAPWTTNLRADDIVEQQARTLILAFLLSGAPDGD